MRVTSLLAVVSAISVLAGCVAGPAGNQLQIDNDGGGKFSGHAGMDWSEEELKKAVGGMVCGGAVPKDFYLRVLSGSWLFSGSC